MTRRSKDFLSGVRAGSEGSRPRAARPPRKTPVCEIAPEQQIVGAQFLGKVRAYKAARKTIAVLIEAPLAVGDSIRIKGRATDLTQRVERIEAGRERVQSALAGELVAVEVAHRVRLGDAVFKL